MDPVTQYAYAGDVAIAYKVSGKGDIPLVVLSPSSNVDLGWDEPVLAEFFGRLGAFTRVIAYDKRGTGLSDRNVDAPTLEERAEDVLAVLDAVGADKAALFGVSEGGSLAAYCAATHPARVSAAILFGTPSRVIRDEAHPWGLVSRHAMESHVDLAVRTWGTEEWATQFLSLTAPSIAGDERFVAFFAKWQRASLSKGAVAAHLWSSREYDLVDVFPTVRVPTMIMQRVDELAVPVAQGRRLAEVIPDARYVELPGVDHLPFVGDTEAVLVEIEEFLTGRRSATPAARRLLTLLVTDIVGSTTAVDTMGDGPWATLLARFDDAVRRCIARFAGHEVKQTGDGFLLTFDGPARAIHCGMAVAGAAEELDLAVRTGIHTGECELRGEDLAGIAVHVASRLADRAAPGQILASATVRDLVAGSGIRFGDGVDVELPGLAGLRTVHEVLRQGAAPSAVRQLASRRRAQLTLDGDYWTVAFDGQVAAVRDSAGVADLSRLLEQPGRDVHALDLGSDDGGSALAPAATAELVDEQARAEYKERLLDLEADIGTATEANDDERAALLTVERDHLVDQLTAAYGIGQRERTFDEEGERARKAASKRIRTAIERIEAAHPRLGRHLQATIRTGIYCSYQPDPIVHWDVRR